MSFNLSESVKQEKEFVQSFFSEDVELEFSELRQTYSTFKVMKVDGIPPNHNIEVDFYNDKIYLDPETRAGYAGKLTVGDKDTILNHCCVCSYTEFRQENCTNLAYIDCPVVGEKVSLGDKLMEAYLCINGRYPAYRRKGISENDAKNMLLEALAEPSDWIYELDTVSVSGLAQWIEEGGIEAEIKLYNIPVAEQHAQRWGTLYNCLEKNSELDMLVPYISDIVEKYESHKDVSEFLDGLDKDMKISGISDMAKDAKTAAEEQPKNSSAEKEQER